MDIGVWEVGLLEVSQKSQANRVFTESERKTKGQYVEESRVSIIQRRMTEQEERKRESAARLIGLRLFIQRERDCHCLLPLKFNLLLIMHAVFFCFTAFVYYRLIETLVSAPRCILLA